MPEFWETIQFAYGNLKGKYFTQWRIDELSRVAHLVLDKIPTATDFKLWYDDYNDFHHLDWKVGELQFSFKYYKVVGLLINGWDEDRFPVRIGHIDTLIKRARDRANGTIPTPTRKRNEATDQGNLEKSSSPL